MRTVATVTLLTMIAGQAVAAPDDPALSFDAVSVKSYPEGEPISWSGCQGGPGSSDPGQINCQYVTLTTLVAMGYQVKTQEVFGPGWAESTHFNIIAKPPQGTRKDQVPAMYRSLLTTFFKLELHHESRLLPAYSLTVAKGGIKMKESVPASAAKDAPPADGKLPIGEDGFPVLRPSTYAAGPVILFRAGRARLQAGNTSVSTLAEALSRQLDKVVANETGLSGKYDITLYWTPDATEPGGSRVQALDPNASAEATAPAVNLFTALERQLGLKLEPKKMAHDTLVIDRAEKVPIVN